MDDGLSHLSDTTQSQGGELEEHRETTDTTVGALEVSPLDGCTGNAHELQTPGDVPSTPVLSEDKGMMG